MTMAAELLSSPPVPSDLDERQVAKAALEAAEEQLRSLCATHAGTFVAVERRGASLSLALADLQTNIKTVEVTTVQHALEDGNTLSELSEKHRVRRRTLLQHSSLLELLELPSLMDACVRSNLYEEALSIASFANTLERRHTEKNAVVLRVIAQIRSRQSDLRRHLLFRLKQTVTMPQCLEVVTALRRLNSIDLEGQEQGNVDQLHDTMELKLQVDFLEARDAWLDSSPRAAASAVAGSEQLLDTIERYRTRVFEIATQFNAIFRASPGKKGAASSASLLSMWVTRRVHSFLTMLSASLNRMDDSASLRDALEACAFFATSMGRLGGDFTAMLSHLFEPKMVSLVTTRHWNEGVSTLQETLQVCRNAGVAAPLSSSTATASVTAASPDQPPRQLLAFPPLARLVNSYLQGLNELRRCLLPGVFATLRTELNASLSTVRTQLETNQRAVNTPGLRGEAGQLREVATEMLNMFDKVVDPYVRGALEVALGDFSAAKEYLVKKVEEVKEEEEELKEEEKEGEEASEEGDDEEGEEAKEEEEAQESSEPVAETPLEESVAESAPVEESPEEPAPAAVEPEEDAAPVADADGWDEDF